MQLLDLAKSRLVELLHEFERLEESEFPYKSSKDAIQLLKRQIEIHLTKCQSLGPENAPDVVREACRTSLIAIDEYLPLLGFFLRSTNVRNGFEVYGPLLRIARKLLGSNCGLILSSEWQYGPYMLSAHDSKFSVLRNFVLIGLPAHESSNPLILPLAGHELGHGVWRLRKLRSHFLPLVEERVITQIKMSWDDFQKLYPNVKSPDDFENELFAYNAYEPALESALCQIEESFCDFIGIRIFGEAFLSAFAYLLAPSREGYRSTKYPNMITRIQMQLQAASSYGVSISNGVEYQNSFDDLPGLESEKHKYQMTIADAACAALIFEVIGMASDIVEENGIALPDVEKYHHIFDKIRELIVPYEGAESLANIINAGWLAFHDRELWADRPHLEKNRVLPELLLKNIEILEIEARRAEYSDAS